MIKLIVGLGNPGQEYEKTRHNAGFLFLDHLYSGVWLNEPRFNGQTAVFKIGSEQIRLLKPMTFMNRSGQAVGNVARYYKISPEEILVVHDELDFKVGIVKLKKGGGHAGHNGLRDVITHLNSNDFYRLRIGIDRPSSSHQVANYVLSTPSKVENENMCKAFSNLNLYFEQIVLGDIAKAMNGLNAKN
ncbi:MAG: aminoacyl-tRNA hydrolase [Methylococcales bacterium]|nr:aminoacyl-tRNA hydrolase [Methylococcales bacterium]MDD5754987.1 aminoacyl-tRNA hydrolase [Methylococcales bacterium]